MVSLTGCVSGRLIKVDDLARWTNLELTGCVVVGGPTVRFSYFQDVVFMNCIFLYDGMEVEGREWLDFMSRERMSSSARPPRRGTLH
jgi:hypothetical protein